MASVLEHPPARHRSAVDACLKMVETGILPLGARVELIEGDVIDMAPSAAATRARPTG